jgi:hypothetical protein
MDMLVDLALTPLGIFLFGYAGLITVLAVLVQPMRLRMTEISNTLLATPGLKPAMREKVNGLIDTCMSFRVGLILPIAIVSVITDEILEGDSCKPQTHQLSDNSEYHKMLLMYLVSILVANPIMSFVNVPLLIFGAIVHSITDGWKEAVDGVELPVLKAATNVAIATH